MDKTFLSRQDAYQQTDSNCRSEVPKKLMWDGVNVSFEGSDVNRKWIPRVPRGLIIYIYIYIYARIYIYIMYIQYFYVLKRYLFVNPPFLSKWNPDRFQTHEALSR